MTEENPIITMPASYSPVLRDHVMRVAERTLSGEFVKWLDQNFSLWVRFEVEALAIWNSGRKHYSARTIGEFLRHQTMLRAANDGEWKLNNNRIPDMARLFMWVHPSCVDFFELREPRLAA
jgi:hypothetical protein